MASERLNPPMRVNLSGPLFHFTVRTKLSFSIPDSRNSHDGLLTVPRVHPIWVIDFEYCFKLNGKNLADAAIKIAASPPRIGQQVIVCGISAWEN